MSAYEATVFDFRLKLTMSPVHVDDVDLQLLRDAELDDEEIQYVV